MAAAQAIREQDPAGMITVLSEEPDMPYFRPLIPYMVTGKKTAYSGTFGIMNATQIAEEAFVSMGTVHTRDTNYEVHVRTTASSYRKVVFSPDGEHLLGVVFIGNIQGAGMYRYVIRESMPIRGMKSHLINQTLNYGHFMRN
jgi:NAD(P)H-nitrite reductase large subunit